MLTTLKNYLTRDRIILISIILFLLFAATSEHQAKKALKQSSQAEVSYWKDKAGNAHATVEQLTLEKTEMKRQVDSISRVLKLRPRQITHYVKGDLRIDTIVEAEVDTLYRVDTLKEGSTDTVKRYLLQYQDSNFIKIKALVPSNPQKIEIGVSAQLNVTRYWRRKWFLGRKTEYVDITTNNPYLQIDNAKAYQLTPPAKLQLRVGLIAGLGYNPFNKTLQPVVGVGISLHKSH